VGFLSGGMTFNFFFLQEFVLWTVSYNSEELVAGTLVGGYISAIHQLTCSKNTF
jgi:hypothetical protein